MPMPTARPACEVEADQLDRVGVALGDLRAGTRVRPEDEHPDHAVAEVDRLGRSRRWSG